MKLSPVQIKTLEVMKDGDLVITTEYGASYLEKDASLTFSTATLNKLIRFHLIDSQHDGNWNSGSRTHQITKLGRETLEELK
jgi:hypothetical protein